MPKPIRTILVAAAAGLLSAALGVAPATAGSARRPATTAEGLAALPAVQPVIQCADVLGVSIKNVTLKSATVVTANTPAPYCEVRGTIAPNNTIVVRLPVNGWTQRFVQTGCGGLCGSANISYGQSSGCPVIADGTVASATTDMGHQDQNDGSWAAGNPQAQIDFAYRGVHETAVAAKALIKAFYKRAPAVLTPVMAWVESGTQPGKIVASSSTNGTVTRTRPVELVL